MTRPAFAYPSRTDDDLQIPAVGVAGSLYPIGKMQAHIDAVPHLAISVFLFDTSGQMLLQRRALTKYHAPGLWANACCSHPHWGETLEDAASRRLTEELGFTVPLTLVQALEYRADVGNGLTEWEHVTVFEGMVTERTVVAFNPEEVDETVFMDVEDLLVDAQKNPDVYAPWFKVYLARYQNFGFGPKCGSPV